MVDAGTSIALTAGGLGLSLATSVVVARTLGPEGKGNFSLVTLLSTQLVVLASLGLDVAAVHFIGKRALAPGQVLKASLLVGRISSAAFTAVGAILLFAIFRPTLTTSESLAALGLLVTTPAAVSAVLRVGVIRAAGRLVEGAGLASINRFVGLLGVAAVALAGARLHGFLVAMVVGVVVQFAVAVLLLRAEHADTVSAAPSQDIRRPLWRQLAGFGIRGHIGTVVQALNYRLDAFLVAGLVGAAGLGLYSVAVGLAELLALLPNALGIVLLQRAATLGDATSAELTARVTRLSVLAVALAAVALVVVSSVVIRLTFGPAFVDAVPAVVGLAPGMVALTVWKNLTNDLSGRGHPTQKTVSAGIGLVLTVVLDLLLIPRLGIRGAAYASSFAYIVTAAVSLVFFTRVTGTSLLAVLLPRPRDLSALRTSLQGGKRSPTGTPRLSEPFDPPAL